MIVTSYTAPSTVMLTFIAVFDASQDGMNLPLVFLQVLLSVLKGFSNGLWM